ncbi:MAG: glycoside hydrolase family 32 protein [Oscillospiraceae bacterium]|nr:glycoside hydrolase family 32 protein [Oscillospiraceae bacterium]
MIFTFSNHNGTLTCASEEQALTLVRPDCCRNQQTVLTGGRLLFDGYSMYFRGETLPVADRECFSVSLRFLPLTFSAHTDGLISCCEEKEHAGLQILLKKGGVINVRLGLGRETIAFSSRNAHALPGVTNILTLIFRGNAGWCDLYINGVFSNRKQFRRHTLLCLPQSPWYLGKRFTEYDFAGCYYGFMDWVTFDDSALTQGEVLSLHRRHFTGEYEAGTVALGMPDRKAYRADRHRPAYHLIPPGKWMNEPHGPMYFDGWYHIFYQANPHAPIWDHLAWGHLISRDMVHWLDCPLALTPEGGAVAPDGIWSGSSVVGKDGVPRLYFTAGNHQAFPNQAVALATPATRDDGKLLHWNQHPAIIQTQDIGWMGEYRDPFVWLENDTYFMLVGTGDENNGGGNAALYSSPDGMDWTSHGMLVDYDYSINSEVGHVWELPVLLPLRDEYGTVVCHALLLCACQIEGDIVETYYFLGHWDPENRSFTKLHEKARLIDLGRGCFTGPSGFVTPDGRSILFTIAQGRRRYPEELHAGWAHNGGIPVELFWKNGGLGVRPIREMETLRSRLLLDAATAANDGLRQHPGDRLSLEVTAPGDTASVSVCAGDHRLEVRYDRHARRLEVLDAVGNPVGRYRGSVDDVDIGDDPIRFTCYLDHSMIELYLNETKSVTLRNYWEGERFFQVSGEIDRLMLWEMDSAYSEN